MGVQDRYHLAQSYGRAVWVLPNPKTNFRGWTQVEPYRLPDALRMPTIPETSNLAGIFWSATS